MPNVVFDDFTLSSPRLFLQAIDRLTTATITGFGPTVTFLASGSTAYGFGGSGFTYALPGDSRIVTGGVLTGINVFLGGALPAMSITGLNLGGAALQNAIDVDRAGTTDAAVENLFLSLGWAYTGRSTRDILLATDVSSDGTALNLSGNDTIATGGGRDDFFLGAGNDQGFGGNGDDRLDGGRGRDTLSGEAGHDTLLGGSSADILFGGTGNDTLDGGSASDRLTGGRGSDTLTGGAGTDVFIFAPRDGTDQITDFTLATDRIDLAPGTAHSFTASGADTVLHYGSFGDQILLVGIDISETGAITII